MIFVLNDSLQLPVRMIKILLSNFIYCRDCLLNHFFGYVKMRQHPYLCFRNIDDQDAASFQFLPQLLRCESSVHFENDNVCFHGENFNHKIFLLQSCGNLFCMTMILLQTVDVIL